MYISAIDRFVTGTTTTGCSIPKSVCRRSPTRRSRLGRARCVEAGELKPGSQRDCTRSDWG